MLKPGTEAIINRYCENEPVIAAIHESLTQAVSALVETFQKGGKLLVCGNGGSCADADHIVGGNWGQTADCLPKSCRVACRPSIWEAMPPS